MSHRGHPTKRANGTPTQPAAPMPPKRAPFTITISLDPNTGEVPQTHVAVLGDGAAWETDVLSALLKARDNIIAEIVAGRVQSELHKQFPQHIADNMKAAIEPQA